MRKCYGCLKTIKAKYPYCGSCQKNLFDGRKIKPLSFDKTEFYEIKSRMTRFSISGVQDKISLGFSENKHDELVPVEKNGRYILKPIPKDHEIAMNLEDIVANEHLSMQISQQVFEIKTAYNGLIEFSDGELAYITKRFDYYTSSVDNSIQKIDQEDFASVLSYTEDIQGENYKYNASYEECAEAIKRYIPTPIVIEDFYKRIVLNYLIGNADAHLKNFSIARYAGRDDYELSPNYDLLYTGYHLKSEIGCMGLDLFKDCETKSFGVMGYYTLEDFEEFAKLIGIPKKRLQKIFASILSKTGKVHELIERSFLSENGKEAYRKRFDERLKYGLCYCVSGCEFESITQEIIKKHLNAKK